MLEDTENNLPTTARESLASLYEEFLFLAQHINQIENRIKSISEQSSICKKLDGIQGIGELAATALYASIRYATLFKNGRHFLAFFRLIPRHDGSGDKSVLKGINKSDPFSLWANSLRERRGFNKACKHNPIPI